MVNRRRLLTGLIAAPSIVAIDSLMPLRGIILNTRASVWVRFPYDPPYSYGLAWIELEHLRADTSRSLAEHAANFARGWTEKGVPIYAETRIATEWEIRQAA